jgi:hypothetical protein
MRVGILGQFYRNHLSVLTERHRLISVDAPALGIAQIGEPGAANPDQQNNPALITDEIFVPSINASRC